MPSVTITIGLSSNLTREPLPADMAQAFIRDVSNMIHLTDGHAHVTAAASVGEWTDEATGITYTEESRTWVACIPDEVGPELLVTCIGDLCEKYQQDAIAVSVGVGGLIGAQHSR